MKPTEIGKTEIEANPNSNNKHFKLNSEVIVRNYSGKTKWLFGTVGKICGKLHYIIQLEDGRLWKCHVD